jgi:uncharacterized protein YbjT (DUF2867 family)
MKTVLVTGATGFTGSHVVPLLLANNWRVRCLVRPNSKTEVLPVDLVELVHGDLDQPDSLARAMNGAETLVNIASLGFGHAPGIVAAAVAAEIRRCVFISTTAVFTTLKAASKSTRLAAEEMIRQSGLAYTILRPTMIFGGVRDRNICRLIRYLSKSRFIPVLGDGQRLQQPVYVNDLARAIVQALESETAIGRTYNISGQVPITYNELIDTVSRVMGREVYKIHLPLRPAVAGLSLLERLYLRLPIKAEQVERLNEDKAFTHEDAQRDFGYEPHSFVYAISRELEEIGSQEASADAASWRHGQSSSP